MWKVRRRVSPEGLDLGSSQGLGLRWSKGSKERRMKKWQFTLHAKQRLKEMKLTQKQVLEVVNDPEVDYVADEDQHGEGARIAQKGELGVAYNQNTNKIITVIYRRVTDENRDHIEKRIGQ
jgi:hypothetical protein